MTKLRNLYLWIADKRLLDGYIGIMGIIIHYRLIALYSISVLLVSLNIRAWKWQIFRLHIAHHLSKTGHYPAVTFELQVLKWGIDTGKEAARKTADDVKQIIADSDARKKEQERLANAAREAGL